MPTKIEWTDETWNPVTGCSKVSQGCKHCYALREWPRLAANPKATAYFGREFTDVAVHPERLMTPLRWTRPRKVFVNSMSDLFHEDVPFEFIDRVFAVMALSPQHIFQVLTKRPERLRDYMTFEGHGRWGFIDGRARQLYAEQHGRPFPPGKMLLGPLPHVWLGVSVEDQATADERIPLLLQTPAAVRWISAEPLLGAVDLTRLCIAQADTLSRHTDALRGHSWDESAHDGGGPPLSDDPPDHVKLDWVVAGGESGPKARPMHPDWARGLRDQCAAAGVPFLFKQWGTWGPDWEGAATCEACGQTKFDAINSQGECGNCGASDWLPASKPLDTLQRMGKKAAGRLLDGVQHDEYPDVGAPA